MQGQVQSLRQVDGQKTRRQETWRHVAIGAFGGGTGLALFRGDGEAVVGDHHHVGRLIESLGLERVAQSLKIIGRVADARQAGRAVDAGNQALEAVAVVVLRSVRITRPEHHGEGLARRLEPRQHHIGRDLGEPVLLLDIGDVDAGPDVVARIAVQAAIGGGRIEPCGLDRGLHVRRKRDAVGLAGFVVDDNGGGAVPRGHVLDGCRAQLADGRGGEAGAASGGQQCRLVDVIAAEPAVQVGLAAVVLHIRDEAAVSARQGGRAGIDDIGEIASVAQAMASGDRRGVGRRHGRIEGVAVAEVHALPPHRSDGRSGLIGDDLRPQAIGHEDDHIVRLGGRG